MDQGYTVNQKFENQDFSQLSLPRGEYDHCTFIGCNFSSSDLSGIHFSECEFRSCNLSMVKLTKTALRDIRFSGCKMLGLRFDHCLEFLFSVRFEDCNLDLSSFYRLKLKKTKIENCSLREVDFTEADLTESSLGNCDLAKAVFDHTVLEKTDFRTAFHYAIDPELNRIKKAKFSKEGITGLLNKYDIVIE